MPNLFASRMARAIAVALASIAVFATTGCAQLPLAGEVRQGTIIDSGLAGEQLYYSPSSPFAGASQEDIITGFLNAGTGPQNDYAVAREYLSDSFRNNWQPGEETLVETGRPLITFDQTGRSQAVIRLQSRLDAHGVYSVAAPDEERVLSFEFVRERGEWRLSSAPNLTVLIRPIFDVIFQSYSLYFFDKQFKYLVPDVRWLPSRASTPTRMVNELFLGPSDWLDSAVTTAIPVGTKLSLAAVSVANGSASVDLNSKFLALTPTQQQQFKAQLLATLRQLPNVNEVQVLVERSPQSIPDFDARATSIAAAVPTTLTADGVQHLAGATPNNFGQLSSLVQVFEASDFALSANESHAALLSPDGVRLLLLSSIGTTPLLVDNRKNLVRPVFDRQGYVWSVGSAAGSAIRVIGMDGVATDISAGWLGLANRQEIAISTEGSRIAARINTPSGSQVWVSTILRNTKGKPIGLGTPVRLLAEAPAPISIAWAGETTLAILEQNDGLTPLPHLVNIGADSTTVLGLANCIRLIGSPMGELYAQTRYGDLYRYKASAGWERLAQNVLAVHFSGQ